MGIGDWGFGVWGFGFGGLGGENRPPAQQTTKNNTKNKNFI